MLSRRRITAALIGLIVLVFGGCVVKDVAGDSSGHGSVPGADSGLRVVGLSTLPPEAADTWKLISAGGPYPFGRNDGTVFDNREKVLPQKKSGYYHEYTVRTPGSKDRGARRMITGESDELYYTGDHYESFVVVDKER